MKKKMDKAKIVDMKISGNIKAKELVERMGLSGGFTAKKVALGSEIIKKIFQDENCLTFLSFPANIVATGCRGILREIIKRKLVDIVITTCGTLDHDIARTYRDYYHGSFELDDIMLRKKNIHRLGNVLIPAENYGLILEKKLQPLLEELWKEKKEWSGKELIWAVGKKLTPDSIIYWCARNQIPMFVPGIMDGAFGSQLWLFWQTHKDFKLDLFKDEQDISDMVFNAKRSGALIIGGGISKHHTIWWNQFRNGLDYAVYITTAVEWDGSLSGARTREAISWGKIKERAKHVTIEGDATVLLPLLVVSALGKR